MKKTVVTLIAMSALAMGTMGVAVAAGTTTTDVQNLTAAESHVVSLLHSFKTTAAWKVQFKAAIATQTVDLSRVNADLSGPQATTPATPSASVHTLSGTFILENDMGEVDSAGNVVHSTPGAFCTGSYGSSPSPDIKQGLQVTVASGSGALLGIGTLGNGKIITVSAQTSACEFRFSVPNLPNSAFYAVKVGTHGPTDFSLAQVEAMHWAIVLTLG